MSRREQWQRFRGPIVVGVLVLLAGTVLALTHDSQASSRLDPRSAAPTGGRALAQVLRGQGVQVDLVTTTAALLSTARPGDTVLVTDPALLGDEQSAQALGLNTDLLVVGSASPERFLTGVIAIPTPAKVREPGCSLPAAQRAGRADGAQVSYRTAPGSSLPRDARLCYPADGAAALVASPVGGRTVALLGSARALTNDRLDDEGNAALALTLLGAHSRLVWYLPTAGDGPVSAQRSFYRLVPVGVWWALGQLMLAAFLAVFWRARRLGAVVTEPLPVVVRAAEAVEGRARLYRRTGARGHAAEALRGGTRDRVGTALRLPRETARVAVVAAAAHRTSRPGDAVGRLLYGPPPVDDAALVRLADDLDALEKEVRRS